MSIFICNNFVFDHFLISWTKNVKNCICSKSSPLKELSFFLPSLLLVNFYSPKMFDFSGLCGKWCFERAWTLVTHRPKSFLRPRPQLLPRPNRQAQEVIRPKKSFLIMVTSLGRPKHRRSIGQLSVTNFRFRKTYPDCRGIIDRQMDNTHLPTTAEV